MVKTALSEVFRGIELETIKVARRQILKAMLENYAQKLRDSK
jgi:hypothetical protein